MTLCTDKFDVSLCLKPYCYCDNVMTPAAD